MFGRRLCNDEANNLEIQGFIDEALKGQAIFQRLRPHCRIASASPSTADLQRKETETREGAVMEQEEDAHPRIASTICSKCDPPLTGEPMARHGEMPP